MASAVAAPQRRRGCPAIHTLAALCEKEQQSVRHITHLLRHPPSRDGPRQECVGTHAKENEVQIKSKSESTVSYLTVRMQQHK